jgi:hypothetical protein
LEYFAFEEPYFDADFTVHRLSFYQCVINVGAESMEWRTPFLVFFRTRNLSTPYTTANTDFDSFAAGTHGTLDGTFDRTTVVDTGFDLFSDLFADNIGIQLWFANFKNIDLNFFASEDF